MTSYVGTDVGKASVVVAVHGQAGVTVVANTRTALRDWARRLPAGSRIGVEATGAYHREVVAAAQAMGHTVYLLIPRAVRHYAQAVGRRAKTDRVDAQLVARYVAQEHAGLRPYRAPSARQAAIATLLERRHAVVKAQASLRQALQDLPAGISAWRRVQREFTALLAQLDARLNQLAAEEAPVAALRQRLRTTPGIGPLLSLALANLLSRYRFQRSDALIAFVGYDPRADDSGQHRGRRRLSKRGPAEVRRLLYAAAMAAARTKVWQPLYQQDRQRGLSATEAIIILARRLARTAFALARTGAAFDPARVSTACAKP
jgi:transposase